MSRNKLYYILLSLAVSVLLIWLLLSRIKIKDLLETLSQIHYLALTVFIVTSLFGSVLRAWRYKLLLEPKPITWGNIFLVTLIRNLFVDLLPARIGSLSYIYVLNKRLNFPFEIATSTFVVALVFDFLTLSPFLVVAVFAVGLGSTVISSFTLLLIASIFFLFLLCISWQIIPLSGFVSKIYQKGLEILHVERRRWASVSVKKINLTIDCLFQIRKKKIYWPIFFLSLLIRTAKYTSLYFLLFSLLRSHGFLLKDLSFWKTILGITGAELSSALPIQGIGGFGTWESAWALTFNLMNFDQSLAIISGMGVHLIANSYEYLLGISSILILALSILKKKKKT